MTRTLRLFIALAVVAISLYLFVADKEKKVEWKPTYDVHGKNPLDLYVLNQQLPHLVGEKHLTRFGSTPYEYLTENIDYDVEPPGYSISGTMLSIGRGVDDASVSELLLFAAHGNTVLVSASLPSRKLLDSLGLEVDRKRWGRKAVNWTIAGSAKRAVTFEKGSSGSTFSKHDAKRTQILGYSKIDGEKAAPNYVRVKYRNGYVYVHLSPEAFSNYYLLNSDDARMAEEVLTLLPRDHVFFFSDDHGSGENQSMLRYVFNNPELRWAWYILLLGLLLFILFNVRRKQRIVPIVKPLGNTTVEFVQTIGNLYRQEGDHGRLAEKKIVYFLERIRQEFKIETTILDEAFILRLHHKSGKPPEDIRRVIDLIQTFRRNRFSIPEEDLIAFNEAIEHFFN